MADSFPPSSRDPRTLSFSKEGSQQIRGGRRNQSSRSYTMGADDPRHRRQPQAATTTNDLAGPLQLDSQGRVSIKLDGALYVTPDGKLALNPANGVKIAPGSPMSIQVHIGDDSLSFVSDGGLIATPSTDQVRNVSYVEGSTVTMALNNLKRSAFPPQLGFSI